MIFCVFFLQEESSHKLLLNEGDLVELLAQFPFTEMFSHILLVDTSGKYTIMRGVEV